MPFQSFGPHSLEPQASLSGWGVELRDGVTAVYGEMSLSEPLQQAMRESLPGLVIYIPNSGETTVIAKQLRQPLIVRAEHAYVYSAEADSFDAIMKQPGCYGGLKLFFESEALHGLTMQAARSYCSDPKRPAFCELPLSRSIVESVGRFSTTPPNSLVEEMEFLSNLHNITAEALTIWSLTESVSAEPAESQIDTKIERADHYLKTHLSEPPAVITLSNLVGLNHMTMKRGFRRLFGRTVYGRLRFWRMQRAEELIKSGMTVTEAALEVGYANPSKFAAAFRREIGRNPSEFAS
ncbi:MAG: AraC family transcriptional regulator [Pseudomonadota bacterium]